MSPQGVYPAADVCAVGDEISSTYEGRHITLYADNLTHSDALSYVTKGYPVIWGDSAVGVAFATQESGENPLIAVDTEGIWCQDVFAQDDDGTSNVIPGDALYIDETTLLISKIRSNATNRPFGIAYGTITGGATDRISVKVHWDPQSHNLLDSEMFYFGDGADYTMEWNGTFEAIVASAASKIIGEEFAIAAGDLADGYGFKETNFNVSGQATAYVAGDSTWLNLQDTFKAQLGGGLVTPHTDGIYMTVAAEITGAVVALIGKFTDQMDESDFAWYNLWNLNLTQTLTALFEVNDPALFGYIAGSVSSVIGSVPLFTVGGTGTKYIMIYDGPAT